MIRYSDKRTTGSILINEGVYDIGRTYIKTLKICGWKVWSSEYSVIGDVSIADKGKRTIGLRRNEETN